MNELEELIRANMTGAAQAAALEELTDLSIERTRAAEIIGNLSRERDRYELAASEARAQQRAAEEREAATSQILVELRVMLQRIMGLGT